MFVLTHVVPRCKIVSITSKIIVSSVLGLASEQIRNGLAQVDVTQLAKAILKHASDSTNEEELKIRIEATSRATDY